MTLRLQLGAGRFENMDPKIVHIFADRSWIHLGDRSSQKSPFQKKIKGKSLIFLIRTALSKITKVWRKLQAGEQLSGAYELTDFRPFTYSAGDTLPFPDESIDFIYSEHFFEHLFLDESVSLLKECMRIMRPGAVIRTCVPDADLRTYLKPEPVGFPDPKMSFTDPTKHKTRWSVYSLSAVLELIGFLPVPLVYCAKDGEFIDQNPTVSAYPGNPDAEIVTRMDYISRRNCSLIVDGQKPLF
jgi:predicted SAM-dependent methyltransferase